MDGWPSFLQYKRLSFLANNSRFLILPDIRIPNLASHVLALNLKRLSCDWQTFYGHPIYLAETFVGPQYFKRLSQIPDPRTPRGKRHKKLSVLTVAICALLCSASNYAAIAQWAKSCTQNMLKRLGCRFNRKTGPIRTSQRTHHQAVLQEVSAEAVDTAVYGWLQSLSGKDPYAAPTSKTAIKSTSSLHFSSKKMWLLPNAPLTAKPTKSKPFAPSLTR
ncbi:MAG: DUF4338 domain-containing protein [Candidatus Brocadia sp.]|nr:DUF4338 domain-containing protein [Candidatus Brocadia sp.]